MTEYEDRVISALEQHRYLERRMLQQKIFRTRAGGRYAREVLRKMYQREIIGRFRSHGRDEYIYHLGKRSQKWRHWLDLNRFHFSLLSDLRSWQRVLYWDFEVRYTGGQSDGFYMLKLSLDGHGLMFYLEMDDGANKFDKVQKYLSYKDSKVWIREWWGEQEVFPLVVIVTPRVEEIRDLVGRCKARESFRVIEKRKEYPEILKQIKG